MIIFIIVSMLINIMHISLYSFIDNFISFLQIILLTIHTIGKWFILIFQIYSSFFQNSISFVLKIILFLIFKIAGSYRSFNNSCFHRKNFTINNTCRCRVLILIIFIIVRRKYRIFIRLLLIIRNSITFQYNMVVIYFITINNITA